MCHRHTLLIPSPGVRPIRVRTAGLTLFLFLLAACGGGGGVAPTAEAIAGDEDTPQQPAPAPAPQPGVATKDIHDLIAQSGPAPGQLFLRFTAPTPKADAYEVRSQIVPIDAGNVAQAPVVSHSHTPGTPGSLESILLSGLEPGQTFQFVVRAVRGGQPSGWSHSAEARATDGPPPTAPPNATTISAPGTLATNGRYYRLDRDITATGTAFRITGRDVTLDLGGHTITYGTAGGSEKYGVHLDGPANSGSVTVTNGKIVQSNSGGQYGHAVIMTGGHDARITRLELETSGADSMGVAAYQEPTGTVRIDHCEIAVKTTQVGNRHYPGVAAIWTDHVNGGLVIDHNRITASPQWGIKVVGDTTTGPCRVHHNLVLGTKTSVANGYMIGIYKPDAEVFCNRLEGESRGIHLDATDADGVRPHVRYNRVVAQDQPNAEYPTHWCHGIKLESSPGAVVEHNRVEVVADADHSEVYALDINTSDAANEVIRQNLLIARTMVVNKAARALNWTLGTANPPNGLMLERNVFRSNDLFVQREWHSRAGATFRENAWVRENGGAARSHVFERIDMRNGQPSPGHGFVDSYTDIDMDVLTQWANPGAYDTTRFGTLRVLAKNGAQPVAGASVEIRRAGGSVLTTVTTDAAGRAAALLPQVVITNGPTTTLLGVVQVTVSKAGVGTWQGTVDENGPTFLRVDLAANTGSVDTSVPSAPQGLAATATSCARVELRWDAVDDPDGVLAYLVYEGGALVARVTEARATIAGLAPGTSHGFEVRTLDLGGNLSGSSGVATVLTPPENRGP